MIENDNDLAQFLDELCDHAEDPKRTTNPLPDEVLAPVRMLAARLRTWGEAAERAMAIRRLMSEAAERAIPERSPADGR